MKSAIFHFLVAAHLVRFHYPSVKRNDKYVDDYHGVEVVDHYRWLEQLDSYSTKKFIKAQNKLTEEFFASIPQRHEIKRTLTELWNYNSFDCPNKKGDRYFHSENTGLQNQSSIYVRQSLEAEPEVFFDPNLLSEDGSISLGEYTFSQDGEIFAYALSNGGSDWKTIHFKNVSSGEDFAEILQNTKWPDLAWTHDNLGIFYTRYPVDKDGTPSSVNCKVYYHRLNTSQDQDVRIAEFPKFPTWLLGIEVSHCGKYLILSAFESYKANAIYIASLENNLIRKGFQKHLVPLFSSVNDAEYSYVSNVGTLFFFKTNKNSTNNRLIQLNIGNISKGKDNSTGAHVSMNDRENKYTKYPTTEVIPEYPDQVLTWARLIQDEYLILCYLGDVKNTLELVHLRNNTYRSTFPLEPGTISDFTGGSQNNTELFFLFESFLSPGTIYRCDIKTGEFDCEIHRQVHVGNIDLQSFETKQVYYPSKDGTAIPMYIVHKKDTVMDGTAPMLLYGYGGFNVNLLPSFSITRLVFIEYFGGIYAVPNIRGGGEYGETWHEEGSGLNKQNVFDDFQAAAEYLIYENYTRPDKMAIKGSSNGGLLVGTCVNQRPELFGAAIADVGVMDMLRFQKFTTGFAWCSEYGCSDNKEDFRNLIKYSPIHNIRMPTEETIQYPAVLVTTADHDDRVVPSHSYKYIAELQYTIGSHTRQTNPLLLRVDSKAGHGEGKSTAKEIQEETDTLSFLMESLGWEFKDTSSSEGDDGEGKR